MAVFVGDKKGLGAAPLVDVCYSVFFKYCKVVVISFHDVRERTFPLRKQVFCSLACEILCSASDMQVPLGMLCTNDWHLLGCTGHAQRRSVAKLSLCVYSSLWRSSSLPSTNALTKESGNPVWSVVGSDRDHWLSASSELESLYRSKFLSIFSCFLAIGSGWAESSVAKLSRHCFLRERKLQFFRDCCLIMFVRGP